MKIAVVANTAWYLFNFRLCLMQALARDGHEVVAISPFDERYALKLEEGGIRHVSVPVKGAGTSPFTESVALFRLYRAFRVEKIDVALSYTPKGNIYSALAAKVAGVGLIPNVSGLGWVFTDAGPLARLVQELYRRSFRNLPMIFFQNFEDQKLFESLGIVQKGKTFRLPGSGVDVEKFQPEIFENPVVEEEGRSVVFLMACRLIREKGVYEFVEAARRVRKIRPNTEFRLLGFIDSKRSSAIPEAQIMEWQRSGLIRYLGATDDMRAELSQADCVVLPSYYREGVPRVLLEAAAMEKPLIAAASTGCRETVDDGVTGYLCLPKNAEDLAEKMARLVDAGAKERANMGQCGRKKMLREFDERIVIEKYLKTIRELE